MSAQVRRKPGSPASLVPPPESKAARGASAWDRRHPTRSYRDIPDDFHEELRALAERLEVSTGALLYFFAAHGKREYDAGRLEIPLRPQSRRFVLGEVNTDE